MPIDSWSVQIFRVANGFLTKQPTVLADGTETEHIHVFEDDRGIEEAMVDALWHLLEFFGLLPTKRSPKSISVEVIRQEEDPDG